MSSPPVAHDHAAPHGHHGHHHHHHRHHRPLRTGTARPERPAFSLLTLSITARLGAAALLSVAVWALIGWAIG